MSCEHWQQSSFDGEERCNGTRERDIVTCGGDPLSPQCVYYKENKAKKQAEIENAIRAYKKLRIDLAQNKDETLIMEGKCYKDNITGEVRWEWTTP